MFCGGSMKLLPSFLILFLFLQVIAGEYLDADSKSLAAQEVSEDGLGKSFLPPRIPPRINCDFACARRCMRASRQKVCARACGTCCVRCQCVPAGTFGNKNSCPCYANLTTRGGRLKCP